MPLSHFPNPVKLADLLHTVGGRCAALPSAGRLADGVERFRVQAGAAPNGTTERQHRITGDAVAEAAPNDIAVRVKFFAAQIARPRSFSRQRPPPRRRIRSIDAGGRGAGVAD